MEANKICFLRIGWLILIAAHSENIYEPVLQKLVNKP